MDVLLNLEHLVLRLQVHADGDVQRLVLVRKRLVVGILHIASGKLVPLIHVDIVLDEILVEVLNDKVLSLEVNNRTLGSLLVDEHDGNDAGFLGNEGIVGTEVRRDMYDTCTVFGSNIVTGNHLESIAHRLDGRHQLLILHAHEVRTLVSAYDAVGNELLTFFIFRHFPSVGNVALGRQVGIQTGLCQNQCNRVGGIGIVGLNSHVVNLRAYAECGIGCQGPGSRGPCQEVRSSPPCHLRLGVLHLEHRRTGGVLHVTVAARLVQLVARQSRTSGRRVRLNGIALVEQALLVELLEQPPQGLNVLVVVGNVRMVKVYEVTHALRQVTPFGGVHHHVLTTLAVVVLCRDILFRLLIVDIGLGDAQLLFYT